VVFRGVIEDYSLLGCDVTSLGVRYPTFRMVTAHVFVRAKDNMALNVNATRFSETSGTTATQRPQHHFSVSLQIVISSVGCIPLEFRRRAAVAVHQCTCSLRQCLLMLRTCVVQQDTLRLRPKCVAHSVRLLTTAVAMSRCWSTSR
jgi:hypothetical protein